MNYKAIIRLIRPKHYLKNLLIFLPLIFNGSLFDLQYLVPTIFAFLAFSMVASAVYVINDLRDKKLDAKHPTKKKRPIASGEVSSTEASILIGILLVIATALQYFANPSVISTGLLVGYLAINILYSFGLKNVPVIDVLVLSLGFVIRVVYGGYAAEVDLSSWLYLAILAISFYLSLGKRRNEIRQNGSATRHVNKFYNQEFLDKNMYVCLGLAIVYYSLWAIDPNQEHEYMFLTIPVVITITMAYSLAVESAKSDGDPVNVLLGNKTLLALVALYGILITTLVYI